MSTIWGENPTILACGHLAEPFAGIGWRGGTRLRECLRCGREDEDQRWQPVVAKAHDFDFDPSEGQATPGDASRRHDESSVSRRHDAETVRPPRVTWIVALAGGAKVIDVATAMHLKARGARVDKFYDAEYVASLEAALSRLEQEKAEQDWLLARIRFNAVSWHGPVDPDNRHADALAVIAGWIDHGLPAALSAPTAEGKREPCYCGLLEWTILKHGRLTHKHGCPARVEPYCQSHPEGCPDA